MCGSAHLHLYGVDTEVYECVRERPLGVDVVGQTGATFTSTTLVNGDLVSLIATSSISGGCLTSPTATSNDVSVTVQVPTTFTMQPVATAACLGSVIVFSASVVGTGTITYQWFKSNTPITGNATAITSPNEKRNLVRKSKGSPVII